MKIHELAERTGAPAKTIRYYEQVGALPPPRRKPMRNIFQKWKTPRLRGHLVWIPMLAGDNLDIAVNRESLMQDERVLQYWDAERVLGRLVSQTLKLSSPLGWDIYLLYSSGVRWKDGIIPVPDFWMHQLNERAGLFLNPYRLSAEVQKAINSFSAGCTLLGSKKI